jgi:hypothetical protein
MGEEAAGRPMSEPVTHVSIKLDQVGLQTLKMALASLKLNAQALEIAVDAQVQEQLAAAMPALDPDAPLRAHTHSHANGHDKTGV